MYSINIGGGGGGGLDYFGTVYVYLFHLSLVHVQNPNR